MSSACYKFSVITRQHLTIGRHHAFVSLVCLHFENLGLESLKELVRSMMMIMLDANQCRLLQIAINIPVNGFYSEFLESLIGSAKALRTKKRRVRFRRT